VRSGGETQRGQASVRSVAGRFRNSNRIARTAGWAKARFRAMPTSGGTDLVLSCPPAGPATADESLLSQFGAAQEFCSHFPIRRLRGTFGCAQSIDSTLFFGGISFCQNGAGRCRPPDLRQCACLGILSSHTTP